MLLLCEYLFELDLQIACLFLLTTLTLPLFGLSSDLLIEILYFFDYGLTLGLVLELPCFLIAQFGRRGGFFG